MKRQNKILQVLDPSHETWVQGGVFLDLRNANQGMFKGPIYLGSAPKNLRILVWYAKKIYISFHKKVIFSSLTPAENYLKFFYNFNRQCKFVVWYTHLDHDYTQSELRVLTHAHAALVHSSSEKQRLEKKFPNLKIIKILGAIEKSRFKVEAARGSKIVWVGTSHKRKRLDILLLIIDKLPSYNFLIIGKDWPKDLIEKLIATKTNVKYHEIEGPLTSSSFDGCNIFIMTSDIEGGPMPLFEAVASGLSPISRNTGFARDIFEIIGSQDFLITTNEDAESISESFVNRIKTFNQSQTPMLIGQAREKLLEFDFIKLTKLIDTAFM